MSKNKLNLTLPPIEQNVTAAAPTTNAAQDNVPTT